MIDGVTIELPCVLGFRAGWRGRCIGKPRFLPHHDDGIHTKSVDAPVEPEAEHVVEVIEHLGMIGA